MSDSVSMPGFPVHHQFPELAQTCWCHATISSSVVPFSSCLQSFWASGSFPVSQFFMSGGQSIGVSASASVLPMNIQGWFPLRWIGWISLQSKGVSRVFSNITVQKNQFFSTQLSLWSNCHFHRASLVAQTVKCLPAMWETWVWSLVREDPSEKEMATHSSTLAWEISWVEEPGGLQSTGSQRIRHD